MGPDRTDPLRVKRTLRRWTEAELELLKQHWPGGGYRVCKPLFPERTRASVTGAAGHLGLAVGTNKAMNRYPPDAHLDEIIRRAYAEGRGQPKRLAKMIGRPASWIGRRATDLGVTRTRGFQQGTCWSQQEDAILRYAIDRNLCVAQIQRKLRQIGASRGFHAIRSRLCKLGGYYEREWTTGEVAKMFGVAPRWVGKQIENGRLAARKVPGLFAADQQVDQFTKYCIQPKAVTHFMRQHPTHWDHRRMNKAVMIDLLLGEYLGGSRDD
jgi:hypothetical protein